MRRRARIRSFQAELDALLHNFAGRPTPLQFASRLTAHLGGPRIYIKREDLLHTGAHKINNCARPGLARRAHGQETRDCGNRRGPARRRDGDGGRAAGPYVHGLHGHGRHGAPEAERVSHALLGAEVVGVDSGSRTLKDAINEAMRDWVTNVATSHYLLGSVLGAHPYPQIVRDFQKVIGEEARAQILRAEGRLPDYL